MNKGPVLMRLMMFTVMISSMSALMFNIVLPQISQEFGMTLAQTSWLTTAYTLIYAFGTVTYGKLADRFQLKTLITFGLTLFAAGSLVGLVSHTFWLALAGRCMQSAGAAALPALALLIPVRYFSPEQRGSAVSMTAVGLALGGALGPVVAAIISSVADWRWLFLPSLLILVLLPVFRRNLANEPKGPASKFDWLGGALLAASISAILLAVTKLEWTYGITGAISLLLFVARVRSVKPEEAFIQPRLFRNKPYTILLALIFLVGCIITSLYFMTPILLSNVYHLESGQIGFALVPAAIVSAIVGRQGGKLADRKGSSYVFTVAACSLIAFFLLLSIFVGIPPLWISLFLILGNVGQSFVQISMSSAVSRTLSKEQAGVGMGLFSMMNFISQGLAASIYGILASQSSSVNWNPLNSHPEGYAFSNLYLVLALLLVVILIFYRVRFGKAQAVLVPAAVAAK
ncbi:MFS transporter [Cohnella soli]|uniref:MFS transporter n=1 Tax=Cohnella soli TaxID=425005 RepID=A0ABW0HQ67_9BACL